MVEMRKKGHTYKNIEETLGVSKWACITYLRSIPIDRSWIEKEWRKAEEEAKGLLEKHGFLHIVNLNEICPSPYWDYYCEKDGERWLIDVTINTQKNTVAKHSVAVKDHHCAILLKKNEKWELYEINMKKKW